MVLSENFHLGILKITDFKNIFRKFYKKLEKNKKFHSNENRKIAKNSKTAVKKCKFLAREARQKIWTLNFHLGKNQKKNTERKCLIQTIERKKGGKNEEGELAVEEEELA